MATLFGGDEKINIDPEHGNAYGHDGWKRTSHVDVGDYGNYGYTVRVGIGLAPGIYIAEFKIKGTDVAWSQGASDELNNSPLMSQKFPHITRWEGYELTKNQVPTTGEHFDTVLALDPLPHGSRQVPVVAWFKEETLAADHWLWGKSNIAKP